ncbi:MAG: PAS domain S-box protein [Syntrophorhabdaceae bacterium]|nr:PAS domain S-box protein [Syntrophorhabdaceae bacterium]
MMTQAAATKLGKAEKAIRESEERFKLLFEKSTDPAFLLEDDRFIDCNEAALKLMYCSAKEQLTGLHPFSISPERQPDGSMSTEKSRELIDAAVHDGPVRFEWKHRTFGGVDLWVDVSLTAIPLHGKQIIHTIWRDITEKKEMEEKLKTETQRFLTLVENAPFGTVLVDKKGNYTYMNTKFKELFGYDFQEVPDENVWFAKAYPDPEYRSHVIATWQNGVDRFMQDPSLKEGERWTFTVTCRDNQQKVVHVIPVQLPTGEYLKTYEDITEQKRAEDALKSREAELAVKSINLEQMNAALKVLLNEREKDRIELEEKIVTNVNKLVCPYIDKLKECRLDPRYMTYVDIIQTNLNDIVSPFLQKLGLKCANLTPTEIRIADLVRSGKTTKEIGEALQMTSGTVSFYRNNIRKKLGLNNEKTNLASYLLSL